MVETQSRWVPSTAWLIRSALLVSLGAAVGQGFARFGYGLLLPPMRAALHWSYAQAGLINSANALGYLAGALAVGPAVARWGAPRIIRVSLLVVSLSLIASGIWVSFWPLMLTRVVSGFATGLIYIAGITVVLLLDPSRRSELPIGVYYAGPGIGIAVSGLIVPLLLGELDWSWQAAWITLGVVGFVALALVELPLRAASRSAAPRLRETQRESLFVGSDYLRLWPTMTAYALEGLGYIGYMTFVVAFLGSIGVAAHVVQWFWVWLGVCAALSGFTWRPLIRRLGAHYALATIIAAQAVGAVLPVLVPELWSFALSALLFGSSFLAVVTVVTLKIRATLPEARWTAVMGNATALFALGQLIGPVLTGLIADMRGGLALGLLGSAALLAVAACVALVKPRA